MRKIYFLLAFTMAATFTWGQMLIPNTSPQSQNFDGIGSSATATLPAGFVVSQGTVYSSGTSATTAAYGTTGAGAVTGSSSGATVNWADGVTASSTDRAVGFLTSGSFTSPRNIMLNIQNTTASTITAISISFDYEKYRSGTRAFNMNFFSGSDGSTWNAETTGDQSYAADANNTTINNPPTTISKTVTITGLNIPSGGNYYFRWAYAGVGGSTNAQGLGVDNVSITATIGAAAGTSTITAGAGTEPASISSLTNTSGAAAVNFDFTITDDGGTNDSDPTLISQIVINQGSNNAIANWTQAIAGAELSDGTNTVTGTVNATNITFASLPNGAGAIGNIADNASKTYTLKVWLLTALGGTLATTIDGTQFEFQVQTTSITTAGAGSSAIATGQSVASGAAANVVAVVATQLAYVQNTTSPTGINVAMTPAIAVSANDANGNRDLGFTGSLQATSTGTLTGSPVSVAAVAGLATFSTLTHSAAGTGLTLNIERAGTLDWDIVSNPFDIQVASSATDYFRSVTSGDWNTAGTWESSADNITWIAATLAPNENANTITIQNAHVVVISTNTTADQVVIANGGELRNTANIFTIADGAGDDVTIQSGGIFTLASAAASPAFGAATARVNVNTNAILRISKTGYTGNGSGMNSNNFIYQNAAIAEYTLTASFSASGVTYFPNVDAVTIPIFRTTAAVSAGGSGNTTFNGIFEANGAVTLTAAGIKTFRNGITGTANVSGPTSGKFVINGATAVLGGTGIITAPTATGLEIGTPTVVTVTSPKSITGNITLLASSFINLGNSDLTVTGTVTGGATNYVRTNGTGALKITSVNTTLVNFPVGNSTYNPIDIINGSNLDWSVRVEDALNNVVTPYNTDGAVNRTWHISPSTPVVTGPDVTFHFDDSDPAQLVNPTIYNGSGRSVSVWHYNGSYWTYTGTTAALTTTNGPQAITMSGYNQFSPFAISKVSSPLPVNFGTVRAAKQGSGVKIDWTNLTEDGVSHYKVERSADGRSFTAVGTVSPSKNNGDKADYGFLDPAPLSGVNYYRIQSVEATGRNKYSIVVKVDISNNGAITIVAYPNPLPKGQGLSLQATNLPKGQYTVRFISMAGQQVATQTLTHPGGSVAEPIQLPASLQAGVYRLQLISADQNFVKSVIIQ